MVEIEIGVMVRQCLDRRISDRKTLVAEIAAWERRRNAEGAGTRLDVHPSTRSREDGPVSTLDYPWRYEEPRA
jgi:hypothetical protein